MLRLVAATAILLATSTGCAPGRVQGSAADLAQRCTNLAGSGLEGATITSSEPVRGVELPDYCRIRGVIEPHIRYEARLPLAAWNGKYYQSGCGGYCGSVLPDKEGFSNTINEALKLGYATITTDNGHAGGLGDASWAEGSPEAVEVYAHQGIQLTHKVGTSLTSRFYEIEPRLEYFGGCSNGGRMAAMAAQRYPALFDGILGGAPVLNLSENGGIYGSWVVQSNTRDDGERILTRASFAAKLPVLEAAVVRQCDALDGRLDGLIGVPRDCRVDLSELPACEKTSGATCFTDEERAVLARWYQGPRDSSGRQLYPGMPPGSERYWRVWFLDTEEAVAPGNSLGGGYARYLGFPDRVPAGWTARDFDFDTDPPRLRDTAGMLDALDPDLRAFRDAGGKFFMWHGWADPLVLPDQSVDYYHAVAEELGGFDEVQSFFRLFMIPGHGHCWELPAGTPDRFNPIRVLEDWVEKGRAPDFVTMHPGDPDRGSADRAAIACPYPARAVAGPRRSAPGEHVCRRTPGSDR